MNQTVQSVGDTISQWVTFRLENETYGIDVLQVQEVLRVSEIAPVPGAPDHVLGIINLRGNVVTVVDARTRFTLPYREVDDASRIIVADIHDKVIGLLVDSVSEVAYLRKSQIESAPNVGNEGKTRFVLGVAHRDREMLILVDLSKLLNAVELEAAAAV